MMIFPFGNYNKLQRGLFEVAIHNLLFYGKYTP